MRATHDDLAKVVALGVQFHAASPHNVDPVDINAWTEFAAKLIDLGGVFVSDGGMIGGFLSPLYFNPSIRYAYEAFWWAPDGSGGKLKREFEAWARDAGAVGIQYTALQDDSLPRVDAIYRRSGALPVEVAYRKRF